MPARKYDQIEEARRYLFIREAAAQNTGLRVEAIQRWCGGSKGESWCCYFLTFVLDICYQGLSPVPRQGSCDVLWALAKDQGWIVTVPAPGDIFLRVRDSIDAHHTGFVTKVGPNTFWAIAGNTSSNGHSSNGDGVYENEFQYRPDLVYVRIP